MRAIKFRGYCLDIGKWVYGYLHLPTDGDGMMIQDKGSNIDSFNVLPDTVGQFTGRIDKNGKEIYEGDILIEPSIFDLPRTVFWDHRFMRFGNISPSTCGYIALHDYSKPEIIGNIHDNPELLNLENCNL